MILLAEDDDQVRLLSRELLERFGYKVIEAVDGDDAIAKYTMHGDKIGLVILDGIMPKKNGSQAYAEISRLNPEISAIFISGYTADVFSREELRPGRIHFLSKPVIPDELMRCVRDALDGHSC